MELESKHWIFLTVLFCSLWALLVSGLILIEELGKIEMKSSLPSGDANSFSEAPIGNKPEAIINVLNFALPLALVGILLLVLSYQSNPIGIGSLVVAIGLFLLAYSKIMDAAGVVRANSSIPLETRIWWMEKTADSPEQTTTEKEFCHL